MFRLSLVAFGIMRVFLIAFVIFFNLPLLARSISLPAGLLVHKWFYWILAGSVFLELITAFWFYTFLCHLPVVFSLGTCIIVSLLY
jgi:hypothetical protein